MNSRRPGACRFRLQLKIMRDEELWWLFLHRRAECSREFWEEVATRKAAGTLSQGSPFWAMEDIARDFRMRSSGRNSNLIELTREEWEARRRRKMFRLVSA